MNACPCGSGRAYAACCGRYHGGEAAPTPEALMRSRYSAYVLGERDYLLRSWHSSTRPADLELDDGARWLGLKVLHAEGGAEDAEGSVEFVARYKIGGRAYRMEEKSRFVREDGRWVYLDGLLTTS